MPLELLKIIESRLKGRKAYVVLGEKASEVFDINIGLPQGSSLSPYLFTVYHSDLINCLGAHSGHLFADDLGILIRSFVRLFSSSWLRVEDHGMSVHQSPPTLSIFGRCRAFCSRT